MMLPPSFAELRKKMCVFLHFDKVENTLEDDLKMQVQIELTKVKNRERLPKEVLYDYLSTKDWKERLKTILGFSNGSLERLKRVYEAFFPEYSFNQIRHNASVRQRMVNFLINPDAEKAIVPSFIRKCFYLPKGWVGGLRHERQIQAIVRNSLQSKYAVQMGLAFEEAIGAMLTSQGVAYEKGKVEMVDKEVDIVIPEVNAPKILIMTSYSLTTSSAQSGRANEQELMYQNVLQYNRRRKGTIQFVNFIDGGGWLARKNDAEKIHNSCDFCFCFQDLKNGLFKQFIDEKVWGGRA